MGKTGGDCFEKSYEDGFAYGCSINSFGFGRWLHKKNS